MSINQAVPSQWNIIAPQFETAESGILLKHVRDYRRGLHAWGVYQDGQLLYSFAQRSYKMNYDPFVSDARIDGVGPYQLLAMAKRGEVRFS